MRALLGDLLSLGFRNFILKSSFSLSSAGPMGGGDSIIASQVKTSHKTK